MIDSHLLDQFIRESGASFSENAASFIFSCPRCGKANKLYIRKRDGLFKCWVCAETEGFSGGAEWALREILDLPLDEIRIKLGLSHANPQAVGQDQVMIKLIDWYGFWEEPPDRKTVEFDSEFVDILEPAAKRGRDYLAARGVPLDVAVSYQLKFHPQKARIIIPVFERGKLYGWQARATRPTEWIDRQTGEQRKSPKILSLKTMEKGRQLMFYDRLIGSEHAVVCEGPFDALAAHLCGGNVATMGKLVSDEQVEMILDSGVKKVYLALDPDADAEAMTLLPKFGDLPVYRLLPAPGFKDLGEMTMEGVLERFHSAPLMQRGAILLPFAR